MTYIIDDAITKINKEGTLWFSYTINLYEYKSLSKEDKKSIWNEKIKMLEFLFQKNIIPWSYTITSLEFSEKENLHAHGILIIKNITNSHQNIKKNILELVKEYNSDVFIDFLEENSNKKRWFMYILKTIREEDFDLRINYNIKKQEAIAVLLDFLEAEYWHLSLGQLGYTLYIHDENYIKNNKQKIEIHKIFENLNGIENYKEIKNIKEMYSDFFINILSYFLQIHDIKYFNNVFLKKIPKTKISYQTWCEENKLIEQYEEILLFFLQHLQIYISNINFFELKKHIIFNSNLDEKIKKVKTLLNIQIKLNFNYIEFKDGVFCINTNKFIKNSNEYYPLKNVYTIKYYNKTYKHLTLPKKWLSLILCVMNFNLTEINSLFIHLGSIFLQNNEILKKKKVLFIVGKSNTYKTTLIANTMINFFGIENIALITKSTNFPFQNFENKTVGIFDEFVYNESLHEEYLKLFEGRKIIIEKKFKEPVVIDPLNIIIISNENFLESKISNDKKKALENRINKITFENTNIKYFKLNDENIKKAIEKEEIEITMFLIKYFYETQNNQNKKWKKNFSAFMLDIKKIQENNIYTEIPSINAENGTNNAENGTNNAENGTNNAETNFGKK